MQDLRKFYADNGEERCGFILKDGSVVEVPNLHELPLQAFTIPQIHFDHFGENIEATWHTHPGQHYNLSSDDYMAFTALPHLDHIIVGKGATVRYGVAEAHVIILEVEKCS